jgi:hypothetical protein
MNGKGNNCAGSGKRKRAGAVRRQGFLSNGKIFGQASQPSSGEAH